MPGMPSMKRALRLRFLGSAATLILLAALAAAAPRADAAPVSVTFDNGRLTIGSLFDDRVILPASETFPSDDLPLPQRTDVQLLGDESGGQVTIPAALNTGVQFPYFHLMHPLEPDLRIPITMRLNEPGLTGTWDAGTGEMTLEGKLDVVVVTGTGATFPLPDSLTDLGVPPLGLFARCRIDDVPVRLSTANPAPTTAEPFTGGFGVHGALTTSWDTLPAAESENGGDCTQLNTLIQAPGGLWLSNGIVEPKPQEPPPPTCETDRDLCPPVRFVEIDGVDLSPNRRKVMAGRKAVLRVRVHNSGDKATRVKVKIRSNNKRVKVPKRILVRVPAEGFGVAKVKVRVKRRARGRARIRAATHGWNDRTILKVRPRR